MTFERRVGLMKPLSATEIEVLQGFADGLGTAEIAESRRTSPQVIKNYSYRACQKLGADNRAHLIARWRFGQGSSNIAAGPMLGNGTEVSLFRVDGTLDREQTSLDAGLSRVARVNRSSQLAQCSI
jgi:DNA-binding CsgD family transcriptional regulator